MSEDLRRYPRENIQIEVELIFLEDEPRTVMTRDASIGGLFMLLNNPEYYTMGEMVTVTVKFNNPFEDFKETTKDAIIVRHSEDGIAIAFIEMEEF